VKVTISKWGNSLGLRVPKELAAEVGLTEGARVDLSVDAGRLILAPTRPSYRLEDLLVGMTPEAMHQSYDWGPDLGREQTE
jgi:antitoxin MazE